MNASGRAALLSTRHEQIEEGVFMANIQKIREGNFSPEEITVSLNRLRPVSEAGVGAVMASLDEVGRILSPVWLRETRKGLVLMDGAHRVAAARKFGCDLPGIVFRCNDRQARFMEIDGNLAGAELTALDTAIFLAERKKLYEEEHPETRRGFAGAEARWNAVDVVSFATATAEKFGLSEQHVRRLIRAGENLAGDAHRLRSAKRPVTLKDLQEIGKIDNPVERYDVIGALHDGTAKSAAEARRAYAAKDAPETAPVDPVEEAFQALLKGWSRSPMAARRRFIDEIADDLIAMQGGRANV